ncbi:MAG: hypothetical protein P8L90_06415 [Flavobacteriaceae bacterium]|nr:hypothetical protein [Flavobacteriaceae bacterium]
MARVILEESLIKTHKKNNFINIFRSFEGGAALIGKDLKIIEENKLGSYEPSQVYHIEAYGDNMYFGLTNYTDLNQVKVVDVFNKEIASYDLGLFPGAIAFWESN